MSYISTDNGHTFQEPEQVNINRYWAEIVNILDIDLANDVSAELGPCSKMDFLKRYLDLSEHDLIIG